MNLDHSPHQCANSRPLRARQSIWPAKEEQSEHGAAELVRQEYAASRLR